MLNFLYNLYGISYDFIELISSKIYMEEAIP